ncbi:MAG: hypothetical protein IPH15_09750 [Comamonadaceae bacterium]|mgnify:CR=1 FL=1|jgi:hypothetical protein|nr:hypothetical protein [Comamonadaceae bacterium]
MNKQIRIPDVPGKSAFALERWFYKLNQVGLLFNPDDAPEEIVSISTGEPVFTAEECSVLNESLDRLFDCHGDKVYDVALKYFHRAMSIRPELASA